MFRRAPSAFVISVLLHIVVLMTLIVSFEFSSTMPVVENSDKNMHVISAVIMDTPRPEPHLPESKPVAKVDPVEVQPKPKPPAEAKAEPKLKVPEPPKVEPKAIALNDPKKKPKPKLEPQVDQDLLSVIKKQKITKSKMASKATQKQLKAEIAKNMAKRFQEAEAQVQGAKVQGVVDKYKALILQAISERWLVPPGIDKKLYAILLIRLAPGGSVLDVQISRSSGVLALDRSARDAVYKASPLPVPEDPSAFDRLRQIELKVRPEDLISGDG